jgi:hypothetical protein
MNASGPESTQGGVRAPGLAVLLQVGDETDALISIGVAGRILSSRTQGPNELFEVLEAAPSTPHAL